MNIIVTNKGVKSKRTTMLAEILLAGGYEVKFVNFNDDKIQGSSFSKMWLDGEEIALDNKNS